MIRGIKSFMKPILSLLQERSIYKRTTKKKKLRSGDENKWKSAQTKTRRFVFSDRRNRNMCPASDQQKSYETCQHKKSSQWEVSAAINRHSGITAINSVCLICDYFFSDRCVCDVLSRLSQSYWCFHKENECSDCWLKPALIIRLHVYQ